MTPLAHNSAIVSSSNQDTGFLSSGRLRSMASDSMPSFLSIRASRSLSQDRTPGELSTGASLELTSAPFSVGMAFSGSELDSIVRRELDKRDAAIHIAAGEGKKEGKWQPLICTIFTLNAPQKFEWLRRLVKACQTTD
jgi:hypothetical protein